MRVRTYTLAILFFFSLSSVGINGAFLEEPKSNELADNPIQLTCQDNRIHLDSKLVRSKCHTIKDFHMLALFLRTIP